MPVRSEASRRGGAFDLETWLVEKIEMEQGKVEPCGFRKIVENDVSLTVSVHVDDTKVSEHKDMCNKFFDKLKQRFRENKRGN